MKKLTINPLDTTNTGVTKEDLINMFAVARTNQIPFVVVGIEVEGTKEAIVVPAKSFDAKEKFYINAYSDDLVHVMNSNVRIFNVIATSAEGIAYIFSEFGLDTGELPTRFEVSE